MVKNLPKSLKHSNRYYYHMHRKIKFNKIRILVNPKTFNELVSKNLTTPKKISGKIYSSCKYFMFITFKSYPNTK